MNTSLARKQTRRQRGQTARTLTLTAIAVILLVALAVSTFWWLRLLLSFVTADPGLINAVANWAQLGLWLLAAVIGALGARLALDQSEPDAERGKVGEQSSQTATAEGASHTKERSSRGARNGQSRPHSDQEQAPSESFVSFYTSGGVRIVAEDGLLEFDEEGEQDAASPEPSLPPAPTQALMEEDDTATPGPVPAEAEPEPLPAETEPELAPLIATPFNLPADLADFTGREHEIEELRRSLRQPVPREGRVSGNGDPSSGRNQPYDTSGHTIAISGVAGMGGIGKTALTLHVAHQMAAEGYFPDAQLYIDLKGTSRQPVFPAAALETLLTALLGADPGRPDDLETLAHLWRGALQGKRALLVLDNAANATQVRPLLPDSPTCTVLVTSRQRFGLPGAKLLDLARLPTREGCVLLKSLAPHLDDDSASAIAERCGGLPLAIRIAGNYLALNNDFPPQEYAALLADERGRLANLSDPSDPDLDVAATLSLSVAQLEVGNRWAWTMLGLFPAPFDADATAALWGEGVSRDTWAALDEDTTVEWLRTLRNRSLVNFDAETRRYRLHDLLYLAAQQEMESSAGVSRARARLAYHFLDVARTVDRRQQYLDLDADWPHLRAALAYAHESDKQLLSDLVLALNDYWSARGMARERAEWNQLAAKASADLGLREVAGQHLTNQGRAYTDRGDARQAIEVYGQALTISRGNGNQRLEGTLLGSLGQAYLALGDARRASHYHEQALEIARATGDRQGEGSSYGDLGQAYAALGDARQAIECFQRALVIAREIGDRRLEGTHLGNLGLAHSALGEARQAVAWQKQALSIHRQTGDRRGEAYALDSLGQAFIDLGQPERAADYYEQALEISRTIGDRRAEGSDLGNLGQVHAQLGDVRRAINFHRQALGIAQETGDRRSQGASLGNLGRAYLELGHPAEAMEAYEQALMIARYIGDRRSEATWLGELGEAHAQLGQITQAVKYHEQALALYQEIGDRRGEGNHLSSLGLLARQQGDDDRAHDTLVAALKTFEAIKDPSAGRVWQWLTELEGQQN